MIPDVTKPHLLATIVVASLAPAGCFLEDNAGGFAAAAVSRAAAARTHRTTRPAVSARAAAVASERAGPRAAGQR